MNVPNTSDNFESTNMRHKSQLSLCFMDNCAGFCLIERTVIQYCLLRSCELGNCVDPHSFVAKTHVWLKPGIYFRQSSASPVEGVESVILPMISNLVRMSFLQDSSSGSLYTAGSLKKLRSYR